VHRKSPVDLPYVANSCNNAGVPACAADLLREVADSAAVESRVLGNFLCYLKVVDDNESIRLKKESYLKLREKTRFCQSFFEKISFITF
jgi:hypothetical protein